MDPEGKTVLVTGGARGIGRDLVERLSREGARVCVLDIDSAGIEELCRNVPGVSGISCDVTDPAAVKAAVEECVATVGTPHLLVNNAGIIYSAPLVKFGAGGTVQHEVNAWDRVLATNLSAVFYVTASVVEKMVSARTRGLVVNISSICAAGNAGQSAYSAAKAGVDALTATWAKELGTMGIRVAGVAPGYTETPSTRSAMSESGLKEIVQKTALRRLGRPDEIVDGIMAVIRNDFFSGKTFALDGGLTI